MGQSWETMTSISAGHIILTPTQPVGSRLSVERLREREIKREIERERLREREIERKRD